MAHRFGDRGDPAQYLRDDEVLVRCPRCAGRAVVRRSRLSCAACGYAKAAQYFGGSAQVRVAGRCGRCGRRLAVTRHGVGGASAGALPVTCPGCNATTRLPATRLGSDSVPHQPRYRGLDLWLQTPCRTGVLWALNESHVDFLERYVVATVREREPNRNGSLASRLPAWVKAAKNRDEVLRGVARLRARLAEG